MAENPFTLMFGRASSSVVHRRETIARIIEEFSKPQPAILSYLITGLRGSGKTVALREVSKQLKANDWIVLDLNPRGDLMTSYAQQLFEEGRRWKLFLDWSLTLGPSSFSLTIKKKEVTMDPEVVARKLTERIFEEKRRILITIDEASATDSLRYFANFYQSIIGDGFPLCLLMTGIRENIEVLSSDKAMSFLSRSPKIVLEPLDLVDVAMEYARVLNVPPTIAAKMAKLSAGYAFAYQVLGYFFVERGKEDVDEGLIREFSSYLYQNGYDVIWKGLTLAERNLLIAMAEDGSGEATAIMQKAKLSESNYQNLRRRLLNKGILVASSYGKLDFALPAFAGYIELVKTF